MATIRIADEAHAKAGYGLREPETQVNRRSRKSSTDDGIYNIRSRSGAPPEAPRLDDDPGLGKESDFKQKQVRLGSRDLTQDFLL